MTPGKVRGLTTAANERGVFTIFAIDHRDALRAILDPDAPADVPASVMTATKLDFVRRMAPAASAILLDPEYSAIEAVSSGALDGRTALLCALEAQGYLGHPQARTTTLLEGWGVEKAKRLGASGVKLLLLYRPDAAAADLQDALVRNMVADCAAWDIPLFLEPVMYALPTDHADGPDRRRVVIESVRRLAALGPDILKVQFPTDTTIVDLPAWRDACAELDEASPVPWTLLSGGDPFESFATQVTVACEAGSSGFLVGRALWAEAARLSGTERMDHIDAVVRPRFAELAAIASDLGTPWTDRVVPPAPPSYSAY